MADFADYTAERVAQVTTSLGLLDEKQIQEAWAHYGRRNISGQEFIQYFMRQNALTNWQVERLAKGEEYGYFCGAYKLLYLVGSGTFSRVYRAQHRDSKEVAAVKVLRRRHCSSQGHIEQFLKEGKMGKLLKHPCIVSVFDVGQEHNTYYIAMEFIEGQNLREFIKIRKKVEPAEATRIMVGICSGLQYAHERGIAHRDLKMSNVLISSTGQPKLVDFGLAGQESKLDEHKKDKDKEKKEEGEEQQTTTRTVDYVGISRASGTKPDDPRNDIYFAGCMYYQMLTGVPPLLETRDRQERLAKSRYTDVTPVLKQDPTVPKSLAGIVSRAMDITVSLRYQAPAEMLAELQVGYKRLIEAGAAPEGGHDVGAILSMWGETRHLQKTVILSESNLGMQDVLRTGLKKIGYRVLMTRDPERALSRFGDKEPPDGAIFSTLEIGEPALVAFNSMGTNDLTKNIPAILLLSGSHKAWEARAQTAPHRRVLHSPIKMRDFREALGELIPNTVPATPASAGQKA